MPKRVFILHGWDGYPEEGWFPWLKKELEAKGFEVHVPALPEASGPRIKNWVPALAQAVGEADDQTYFVGHSMGCQTIARYLESLPENIKVGGVIFVAGFFTRLTNLEDDDEVRDIAREWLETPLDLIKVKSHVAKGVAIFSDDDPYVSLDNQERIRNELGFEIIIQSGKRHFSGETGTVELPIALESLVRTAG